jgi:hypothetical protein
VVSASGTLFVAWPEVRRLYPGGSSDVDIVLTRSQDGGRTWSVPLAVNDVKDGERFMPAITRLGRQSLGLVYYDRRRGTDALDVYAVRVTTGPQMRVSPNVRVNAGSSSIADITYISPQSTCFIPGRFFGDYISVGSGPAGELVAAWADTQLHVAGETDVWFGRVRVPPATLPARPEPPARVTPDYTGVLGTLHSLP